MSTRTRTRTRVLVAIAVFAAAAAVAKTPTTRPTTRPATRPSTAPATQPATRPAARERLGLILVDMNDHDDAAQQIQAFGGNLVVNKVLPDSRAERLGLTAGDAIQRINGKDMKTVQDVLAAVQESEKLKIEVLRRNQPLTLDENEEPESDPRGL